MCWTELASIWSIPDSKGITDIEPVKNPDHNPACAPNSLQPDVEFRYLLSSASATAAIVLQWILISSGSAASKAPDVNLQCQGALPDAERFQKKISGHALAVTGAHWSLALLTHLCTALVCFDPVCDPYEETRAAVPWQQPPWGTIQHPQSCWDPPCIHGSVGEYSWLPPGTWMARQEKLPWQHPHCSCWTGEKGKGEWGQGAHGPAGPRGQCGSARPWQSHTLSLLVRDGSRAGSSSQQSPGRASRRAGESWKLKGCLKDIWTGFSCWFNP